MSASNFREAIISIARIISISSLPIFSTFSGLYRHTIKMQNAQSVLIEQFSGICVGEKAGEKRYIVRGTRELIVGK